MDGPDVRIGDAERDEAVRLLREHLVAGRIDYGEFEERMTAALQARRRGELLAPFADLPGHKPVGETEQPPALPAATQSDARARRTTAPAALRMLVPMVMLMLPMLIVMTLVVLPGHAVLFGPLLLLLLLGRGGFAAQPVRHRSGQHHPYD